MAQIEEMTDAKSVEDENNKEKIETVGSLRSFISSTETPLFLGSS